MKKLSYNVSILIPSSTKEGLAIPANIRETYVKGIGSLFSQVAGGATGRQAEGFWQGETGLAVEPVTEVISYCSIWQLWKLKKLAFKFAEILKDSLHQEAVSVFVNGKLILI
jgi:hypothetical protein